MDMNIHFISFSRVNINPKSNLASCICILVNDEKPIHLNGLARKVWSQSEL